MRYLMLGDAGLPWQMPPYVWLVEYEPISSNAFHLGITVSETVGFEPPPGNVSKVRFTFSDTSPTYDTPIRYRSRLMPRTFAYCRVSTADQTTDNQVREIEGAGFHVEPKRVVAETVSGSVAAMERKGFAKLVDRLETGDVLIVTKLDRLGRNAIDLRNTVDMLAAQGIRVHCLALGGVDLTSAAGRMTMGVIAAVAEFERDLLIERT